MSKLRAHIESIDDLDVVQFPVPEWPHPDDPSKPVVLAIKAPTLHRRNELIKQFDVKVDAATGEVSTDGIELDGLSMAILGEMVFDPDDMDSGPLFPTAAERTMLLDKNGRVCWSIVDECMIVGGFQKRDPSSEMSAEEQLVDEGKDSSS